MTLPTGQISMSQVNVELSRSSTATISLNESAVRTLAGIASGTISMSNLQGKSSWTSAPIDFVLSGGGGGGAATVGDYYPGGGGAGGSILIGTTSLTKGSAYSIVLGAGGAGSIRGMGWQSGMQGGGSSAFGYAVVVGGTGGEEQYTDGSTWSRDPNGGFSVLWPSNDSPNLGGLAAFYVYGGVKNGGGGASRGPSSTGTGGNATGYKGGDGGLGYDLSTNPYTMTGYPVNTRIGGGGGGGGYYSATQGQGNSFGGNGGGKVGAWDGSNTGDPVPGNGYPGSGAGGGGAGAYQTGGYGAAGGNGGGAIMVLQYSTFYPEMVFTGSWYVSQTNTDTSKRTYVLTSSGTLTIG